MKNISRNVSRVIFCICMPIVLCGIEVKASTLPPDPNNAALLYYQAFLLCPEPDYVTKQVIREIQSEDFDKYLKSGKLQFGNKTEEQIRKVEEEIKSHAPDPNKVIREFIRDCRGAIELAQAASEIPRCDWGLLYSRGFDYGGPKTSEIRNLTNVLRLDALILAIDGDQRAAFDRCLMMCRFACHVGDDNLNLYLASISVDSLVFDCIRRLLNSVKPHQETLMLFKQQLAIRKNSSESFIKVLNGNVEVTLNQLSTNKKTLKYVRDEFIKKSTEDAVRQDIKMMTDEEFIAIVKKPYIDYMNSIVEVIDSDIPYQQKCGRIENLTANLEAEHGRLGIPRMSLMTDTDMLLRIYEIHIRHAAHLNAMMTAIEIMLICARTGRLPEQLPGYLPVDPFTDRPFGYELTDSGFALICSDVAFKKLKRLSLEFKVRR